MNSLSIHAAFASSQIKVEQPLPKHPNETGIALCRDIFDDLMDRDLLGFLLSSYHLRKYLAHYTTYAEPKFAEVVRRNMLNVDVINASHEYLLKMFSGVHIEEAKIKDRSELTAVLDRKYHEYASALPSGDVRYETSLTQLSSVEMAWRYRNACCEGSSIAGF